MPDKQFVTMEALAAYSAGFCDALAVVYCELQILSQLLDEKGVVSLSEREKRKPVPQAEFQKVLASMKQIVRARIQANPQIPDLDQAN